MATPRRSKRIEKNCHHAPTSVDKSDALQKRQKVGHTRTENVLEARIARPGKPDKYVRGRRGYLKLMTEIPLDTMYEILRQLDPLDLLYLSWASKSLHGIVMEKFSIRIWEEVSLTLFRCHRGDVAVCWHSSLQLHRHMNGFMNLKILLLAALRISISHNTLVFCITTSVWCA